MATYANTSPWYNTPQVNGYLSYMQPFYIPAYADDITYQIDAPYNFRPDKLSNDIYQTPKLWWVFAIRNPDVIKDPIFDFVTGRIIIIPTYATVKQVAGI